MPLITTAHLPSASNLGCWMENYTNMPIVEGSAAVPYSDTVTPKRLGTVSPLDPQMFSSIQEFVKGETTKYSPLEVADWLAEMAGNALRDIDAAGRKTATSPVFRRFDEDIRILAGLGNFFSFQLRSAVFYETWLGNHDPRQLEQACIAYGIACDSWRRFSERAKTIYRADITFGDTKVRRGHWADRLPAIERDFAAMKALAPGIQTAGTGMIAGRQKRSAMEMEHSPAAEFQPGKALLISTRTKAATLQLVYRRVNQAERWVTAAMQRDGGSLRATIPAEYTNSPFHLQYYFAGESIYPGFSKGLSSQPYYFVKRAT